MESTDVVIIGAGVVGLAAAREVSLSGREAVVLERHTTFGRETSSRNSEVIHAGIYYDKDSLKARACVDGRRLLYELCEKYAIPHKRPGKLIVAGDKTEEETLEALVLKGRGNGVDDLKLLTGAETVKLEPNVKARSAIHSPSTGIVDTHQLMKCLEHSAKERGAVFAYGCEVTGIEKATAGYTVSLRDADGEDMAISAEIVINSAGLDSGKIAAMAGIDIDACGYRLRYSKGEYFRVAAAKSKLVNRLVYPPPDTGSLGIHTVTDMQGGLKLGPNAFYVDKPDYDVDESHLSRFHNAAKRYLPWLEPGDLTPDMAGIRPKLHGPDEPAADFVIRSETDRGFPGLIDIIGIESPGLTASLYIAKCIKNMI